MKKARKKSASSLLRKRLTDEINKISIFSSHEHFCSEENYLTKRLDFSALFNYIILALSGSGLGNGERGQLLSEEVSESEKWKIFKPYLSRLSNLDYFNLNEIVIRDLYGLAGLNKNTYIRIGERMRKLQVPGHYRTMMKMSGVEYALVDSLSGNSEEEFSNYDRNLFGLIYRINVEWFARDYYLKRELYSIEKVFQYIDEFVNRLAAKGVKGIKLPLAVWQLNLNFQKWEVPEIKRSFELLPPRIEESTRLHRPFIDAVVYRFIFQGAKHNMIIQIHAGMQSYKAGEPYLLKNLIDTFPDAAIDIFHAGYPYDGQLAVLASMFRNVYADLCWMASVSKSLTRRILGEWLEMVPANKILAFGSDFGFIDNLFGYQQIVRQIVVEVMEEKILAGRYDEETALKFSQMILRANLKNILDGNH